MFFFFDRLRVLDAAQNYGQYKKHNQIKQTVHDRSRGMCPTIRTQSICRKNPGNCVKTPTPLGFTPVLVLK